MKVNWEQRPAGPELLLVIKRLLLQGPGFRVDDKSWDLSQAVCLEELLVLDSIHEVVEVA